MRSILSFFLVFVIAAFCSFKVEPAKPDILKWSKTLKLEKSDFTLVKKLPGLQIASASTGIYLNYNYGGSFNIRAYAVFSRRKSVILESVTGDKLADILNHEKRHFDITEYMARKLNAELMTVHDQRVAEKLYHEYLDELDTQHRIYDAQTDHFNDKVYQKIWDLKMDSLLGLTPSTTNIKINPQ